MATGKKMPLSGDIKACPKCGDDLLERKYDKTRNLIVVACGCGHSWDERPLDQAGGEEPA